eukprot:2602257-Rhodomonas_salina.2
MREVPPPTMLQLLGLPQDAPPVCTKEQFVAAIKKAVEEDDTVETYQKVLPVSMPVSVSVAMFCRRTCSTGA